MISLKTFAVAVLALHIGGATATETSDDAHSEASPYAGQQQRAIKSLGSAEVSALLSGEGAGMAKPAELNGYPGPAHSLELAEGLGLSPSQVNRSRQLMDQHKVRARELGAQVVAAERALDELFASKHATEDAVDAAARRVGLLHASLRAEHLKTHITQTAMLSPDQVRKYAELRGYIADATPSMTVPDASGHHRRHH